MIEGVKFKCPHCGGDLEGKAEHLIEISVTSKKAVEATKEKRDGRDEKSEKINRMWNLLDMEKLAVGDKKDFWKSWVPKVSKWFDDLGFLTPGQLDKLKQAVEISTKEGG